MEMENHCTYLCTCCEVCVPCLSDVIYICKLKLGGKIRKVILCVSE